MHSLRGVLHISLLTSHSFSFSQNFRLYVGAVINNPNLFAVLCAKADKGAIRESFIVSQLLTDHQVHYHHEGDFLVDEKIVFEIGGKSKDAKQIADIDNAYLAIDDIESGYDNVIPLWLFGFLY